MGVRRAALALTRSHRPSGPAAGPAIPTSNSYSKKTQSNNAENKRPEEDRESGRKASSTAKVPASPLPGLERKKTTPTPSTVSHAPPPPGQPRPLSQAPTLPAGCESPVLSGRLSRVLVTVMMLGTGLWRLSPGPPHTHSQALDLTQPPSP